MDYNLLLIIIGICGVSYILLSLLWHTWHLGIGPTASSHTARQIITQHILELCNKINQPDALDRQVQPNQRECSRTPEFMKVYELGSGWGGLSIYLAQQITLNVERMGGRSLTSPISIRGYELAFLPYLCSKLHWKLHQLWNSAFQTQTIQPVRLTFHNTDFIPLIESLEPKGILFTYLCPKQMNRIADVLAQTEKPMDIYLLSLTFALPGHQAVHMERLPTVFRDPLYLYLI